MSNKIKNIIIILLIIYLVISAAYIFSCVDFGPPPDLVGWGFSSDENVIRNIMGVPSTYSTYKGIPPSYLWSSAIRIICAGVLGVVLYKRNKK